MTDVRLKQLGSIEFQKFTPQLVDAVRLSFGNRFHRYRSRAVGRLASVLTGPSIICDDAYVMELFFYCHDCGLQLGRDFVLCHLEDFEQLMRCTRNTLGRGRNTLGRVCLQRSRSVFILSCPSEFSSCFHEVSLLVLVLFYEE